MVYDKAKKSSRSPIGNLPVSGRLIVKSGGGNEAPRLYGLAKLSGATREVDSDNARAVANAESKYSNQIKV